MIRLGLRLTFNGGREAVVRLVIMAVALALGVGMLLITLAGVNAVNTQNARWGWLATGLAAPPRGMPGAATHPAGVDPLWLEVNADYVDGKPIGDVSVAATGPHAPAPPGIPRLPGPGQFYASPALSELLRSLPAQELADRFPGRQVGTIGKAALPGPDSLVLILGETPGQLSHRPAARLVSGFGTASPSSCAGAACAVGVGVDSSGMDLVLSVVACALLFPVLIFIAAAARLSAARRERRFAAMRLAGATPGQVAVIAATESAVAAVAGAALGFGVFFLARPAIADIPFTGQRFFTSDLSLDLADVLLVALGVPLAAMAVAAAALRRVRISALGVSRRATPAAPRAYRLIPLAAGIAELGYFAIAGDPMTTSGQVRAFLPGALLVVAGTMAAGPWLTMVGARLMARHARRPAGLIAARRLADDPRGGFRVVGGLVLALLVMTVALGVITTIADERGVPEGAVSHNVLMVRLSASDTTTTSVPDSVVNSLSTIRGVEGVLAIHIDPAKAATVAGATDFSAGLVTCAQLARVPVLGRCQPGARVAEIPVDGVAAYLRRDSASQSTIIWPRSAVSPAALGGLPLASLVVGTDGSAGALERARTAAELSLPDLPAPPVTEAEESLRGQVTMWEQLADAVIMASLAMAGCTLAIAVAAGLSERKRPFSLLRLAGVQLSVLRRVVGLETAVPLLTAAVGATGVGFLAAQLFLSTQLGYSLRPPSAEYYVIVVVGLVIAFGVMAATLPLLHRITGPEAAREE